MMIAFAIASVALLDPVGALFVVDDSQFNRDTAAHLCHVLGCKTHNGRAISHENFNGANGCLLTAMCAECPNPSNPMVTTQLNDKVVLGHGPLYPNDYSGQKQTLQNRQGKRKPNRNPQNENIKPHEENDSELPDKDTDENENPDSINQQPLVSIPLIFQSNKSESDTPTDLWRVCHWWNTEVMAANKSNADSSDPLLLPKLKLFEVLVFHNKAEQSNKMLEFHLSWSIDGGFSAAARNTWSMLQPNERALHNGTDCSRMFKTLDRTIKLKPHASAFLIVRHDIDPTLARAFMMNALKHTISVSHGDRESLNDLETSWALGCYSPQIDKPLTIVQYMLKS